MGRDKIVSLIEVKLKDGRILRGRSAEHYRGGPLNPLTREEFAEKFNDCVRQVLNPGQAKKLMETIESLESLQSVHELIELAAVP